MSEVSVGYEYLHLKHHTEHHKISFTADEVRRNPDTVGNSVYDFYKDGKLHGTILQQDDGDWYFIPGYRWINDPEKTSNHIQIRLPQQLVERLLSKARGEDMIREKGRDDFELRD